MATAKKPRRVDDPTTEELEQCLAAIQHFSDDDRMAKPLRDELARRKEKA